MSASPRRYTMVLDSAPSRLAWVTASMAALPAPITTTRRPQLVFGDPGGVEAAGSLPGLEDGDRVAGAAQVLRARQAGGAGADDGDLLPRRRAGREQLEVVGQGVVGGVALQQRDVDRLL